LKDLVVDMAPFFDAAASVEPWLVTDPAYDGRLANERVQQLWSAAQCILCGICESQAIAGDVRHPIAAVHLLRFARDPRDRLGSARLSREQEVGTPDKVFADSLRTVCPKHVDVTPLLRDA
jgi:succinate dehydrogenase / fumarate reductase iron-sulfur subunit